MNGYFIFGFQCNLLHTSGPTAIPAMDQFDIPYLLCPMRPDQVPFSSGLPQAPSGGLMI